MVKNCLFTFIGFLEGWEENEIKSRENETRKLRGSRMSEKVKNHQYLFAQDVDR